MGAKASVGELPANHHQFLHSLKDLTISSADLSRRDVSRSSPRLAHLPPLDVRNLLVLILDQGVLSSCGSCLLPLGCFLVLQPILSSGEVGDSRQHPPSFQLYLS